MDIPVGSPRAVVGRWLGAHFALAAALFFLGVALGWVLVRGASPDALAAFASGRSVFPERLTVAAILGNNLLALGVVLLGTVTFAVPAGLSLLFNGLIVGFLFGAATAPLPVLLALVVPHGVLELPAFWLAGSVSFRVTHRLVRYLRGIDEEAITRTELGEALLLALFAVGLVLLGAVVEVHVTPRVAELLTGREFPGG